MAPQPDLAKPGVVIVDGTTGAAVPTGGTAATAQYTTLVNGGNAVSASNPEPVQLSQGGAVLANGNPIPVLVVANGSVNSLSNPVFVSDAGVGESISKGGTATAPGAGSAILTMTSNLPAGRYRAQLVWSISGAIETAGLNVRLTDASGSFTSVDFPSNNGSANGQSWTHTIERLNVTSGTNTIKVVAVAGAVASTVYSATLTLTQVG